MKQHQQWLERLEQTQQYGGLAIHFTRFMLDRASQPTELFAQAVAMMCRATAEGHVCLDLRHGLVPLYPWSDQAPPKPPSWRKALLQSGVVGRPGEYQPLILDRQDRLYLHRYWDYEQRLASNLILRSRQQVRDLDQAQLTADLTELFPAREAQGVDWQKLAAATAMLRPLCVISGGPGTGKTTTVTKILALLCRQPGGDSLRIALAAPTGKAASRMQQSIRRAKAGSELPVDLIAAIPEQAATLHRLLGYRPGENTFHYHRDNPLPVDVLILDEASMIDVALMAKLLEALPIDARLILLGDKDQLASVEAGAVLGDICGPCKGPSPEFAAALAELIGEWPQPDKDAGIGLCDAVVVLRHSFRFGLDSPIGRLAAAVNRGDVVQADACLVEQDGDNLRWCSTTEVVEQAARRYLTLFEQVREGASVESLFEQLDRFRLLCALRLGPSGVEAMNQRIALRLVQCGVSASQEWYAGRPVMINRNDHQLRLYNGDIGIVLPDPNREGTLRVAFLTEDRCLRWLAPARLPPHESVYAMTVHKSQGSEFDEVLLLLPEQDSPLLSRELVYTAITRARRRFTLAASASVFEAAVRRRLLRQSGLSDLLDQ